MTVDLQHIADDLASESNAIRARIEGLLERDLRINRALDELRLLGVDTPDQPRPIVPPAPALAPAPPPEAAPAVSSPKPRRAPRTKKAAAATKAARPKPAPAPPATPALIAAPRRGRPPKYSPDEVAVTFRTAEADGRNGVQAVAAKFNIPNFQASRLVARARELELIPMSTEPGTSEPITKMAFDPQKVRDEQAGPSVGAVKGLTGKSRSPAAPARVTPLRPEFTPDTTPARTGEVDLPRMRRPGRMPHVRAEHRRAVRDLGRPRRGRAPRRSPPARRNTPRADPGRSAEADRSRHTGGAAAHRRRGERPCRMCLEATAAATRERDTVHGRTNRHVRFA